MCALVAYVTQREGRNIYQFSTLLSITHVKISKVTSNIIEKVNDFQAKRGEKQN